MSREPAMRPAAPAGINDAGQSRRAQHEGPDDCARRRVQPQGAEHGQSWKAPQHKEGAPVSGPVPGALAGTEIARPAHPRALGRRGRATLARTRSEEHTSGLQSLMRISYAVFCLKQKKTHYTQI